MVSLFAMKSVSEYVYYMLNFKNKNTFFEALSSKSVI